MPSLDKEQLPVGVGDREAQARFIASNRDFLLEHPPLHGLLQKVVLRQLPSPSQGELDHLLTLPENDPAVVAFENKVMADRIVFGLGRVIVDDFGEILTLAGNGRGVGANKPKSRTACLPRRSRSWRRITSAPRRTAQKDKKSGQA